MSGGDIQISSMTPLAREALDFVAHLGSGRATVQDAKDAAAWRARSGEHEAAFREAVQVRRGLQALLEVRAADTVTAFRPRQMSVGRRAFMAGSGTIAASVAGAALLTRPPLGLWPSFAELTADYSTAVGERRTITPFAGVSVQMNTRTSIGKGAAGEIALIAGEAFVSVDREGALRATAGNGAVTASKAAFNLRNIDGEVCVTCIAGDLRAESGDAHAVLTAGGQIIYTADRFGAVEAADTTQVASWRTGVLIFQGERLSAVVSEINRYRPGRIVLTDGALASRPVSAVFHLDQMANAVTQVEQLVGARGTHLPGGVVLIG